MKPNQLFLLVIGFATFFGLLSINMVLSSPIKLGNGFIAVDGERAKLDKSKPDMGCNQFTKQDLNDNKVNFENQVLGNGLPPVIDHDHFRWGSNSIHFQVNPQPKFYDCPPGINHSFVTRSELWFEGDKRTQNPKVIPFDQQRFTGFSFKVPHDFSCPSNGSEFIVMQWWQRSPLSPPLRFSLICDGQNPPVMIRLLRVSESAPFQELFRQKIKPAEWYDFVLEYKLSQSASGYVNVWVKPSVNNRYTTYSFPNISLGLSGSEQGLFHKFGIYRPSDQSSLNHDIVWFDEVRNGTTWNDVAPDPFPSGLNYTISNLGASDSISKCIVPEAIALNSIINIVGCDQFSKQQNWLFKYQTDPGAYQIKNKAISNSCLGAVRKTSGSQVTLQSCQPDNPQQLWRVTKVRDISTPDRNDLGFQLQMGSVQSPTNQCLDLVDLNIGSAAKIKTCSTAASQSTGLKSAHSFSIPQQKALIHASSAITASVIDVNKKGLSRAEQVISVKQIWKFW